jgi:hypothetical protein
MDGNRIQSLVYRGYAISAAKIGLPYAQYRPTTANGAGWSPIATLLASFNAEDMKYSKPNKYGHPTWFVLVDGSKTQVGDYLIGSGGTFFIAAQQAILPILAVECNRTISLARPQAQSQVGAVTNYEGNTPATQTPLASGWPASIQQGSKGDLGDPSARLPGDIRSPWWAVLVPAIPGVTLRTYDLIADDLGRRYIISSAELTDLGWRIVALQGQT